MSVTTAARLLLNGISHLQVVFGYDYPWKGVLAELLAAILARFQLQYYARLWNMDAPEASSGGEIGISGSVLPHSVPTLNYISQRGLPHHYERLTSRVCPWA